MTFSDLAAGRAWALARAYRHWWACEAPTEHWLTVTALLGGGRFNRRHFAEIKATLETGYAGGRGARTLAECYASEAMARVSAIDSGDSTTFNLADGYYAGTSAEQPWCLRHAGQTVSWLIKGDGSVSVSVADALLTVPALAGAPVQIDAQIARVQDFEAIRPALEALEAPDSVVESLLRHCPTEELETLRRRIARMAYLNTADRRIRRLVGKILNA